MVVKTGPVEIQFERAYHLPEAVRAEGMSARELDRIGPLAQADATLIHAYVNSDQKPGPR